MNINQLLLGTLLFLLMACGNDTTVKNQKATLVGRWNLIEGQRNGKVTDSLRDTYFEFTADDKMSTNLPIKGAMNSPYNIVENEIVQTIINDIQIKYQILELTPEVLKLTTNLRGFDFVFSMEKEQSESLSSL